MATTINLPNGETASIKDDTELTNREMKELRRAARTAAGVALKLQDAGFKQDDPDTWSVASQLSDEDDDVMDLYQRTCVILRLKHWTLDRDLPVTPGDVDDLERPVYVTLTQACAKVNFSDDFGIDPDPKAIGQNSTSSD